MKSKRSSRAVERILHATDPESVPDGLSTEEKIKWLEAQNHLLRFHYTALVEHASGFSPEEFAKKKELAAVQSLVAHGSTVKDACRVAGIPRCTYYRALKPSAKAESDAELVRLMCDIENDRHVSSTYGIERLTGEVIFRLPCACAARQLPPRTRHGRGPLRRTGPHCRAPCVRAGDPEGQARLSAEEQVD